MRQEVRWTNLTTSDIQAAFAARGMEISRYLVQQLASVAGLRERQMSKSLPGKEFSAQEEQERDQQFHKIKAMRENFARRGLPVLSVDTKKKEFIGQMHRAGFSYCAGALAVHDHDFPSLAQGVVVPHGLYDVGQNRGYLTLGTSRDTSEFLCDNLRHHWNNGLKQQYEGAREVLLVMDGGGSNNSAHYIVKEDLQKLACELGVTFVIAHYPPYCSKYNPIEHRLFCHIQRSWDGKCFESYQEIEEQTEKTTTTTGLSVVAWLNEKVYQTARKYSQSFREDMKIEFDQLLPKWNYKIKPL